MESFRSEIENPVVAQDIIDLERKIRAFKAGELDAEKFRSLRLARGVYGQRQQGVQMIRIKLPYGKVSAAQLRRIAEVSDTYSTGKLHITTRQDIQIHYVDLNDTPQLWAELEKDAVTLREACGNTVRNVTASETTGIDPEEAFDVSPYAQAVFEYFLRNPVGQEMGRKFKVSFSSSDRDTGLSYMHDLGFIAKVSQGDKGFKVMLGGGLGSQPRHADCLYEFLPQEMIIPLMESVLRVFDRYGERKSRSKARLKFLIKDLGLEVFRQLVSEEKKALPRQQYPIKAETYPSPEISDRIVPKVQVYGKDYELWKASNLIPQKQKGYVAIGLKVFLGNFSTDQARQLAELTENYAASEIRLSLRQNILIPFVKTENVPYFFKRLKEIGLAEPGYNSALDITACPGTDTCNLGIASSTGIATELERLIRSEYPQFIGNKDVVIKISGCMNACGQHTMAHIGFQGMSVRTADKRVAPALQVLLGGSNLGNGQGVFADKVIKIPSKKGPDALRLILDDYLEFASGAQYQEYYAKRGQMYFYNLLKPLADISSLTPEDFIDWGSRERYKKAIGVGECAGVVIDLVVTLFYEADEKLAEAEVSFEKEKWAAAVYYAYSAFIHAAKALLTAEDHKTNTHAGILRDFQALAGRQEGWAQYAEFESLVLELNKQAPDKDFAFYYLNQAKEFLQWARETRKKELNYVH
ncbi:HEPN domain-containing protein [Robiginitalea sp. IMCC43444]|uniref:HEPN domain-containing protein n=1 Tax=Robiginitalea sp. IMCC43444 TaxID=3459121 RepID=UPI004040F0CF